MTKTTKSKMLSFLLCFVMIATTFCQTAMTAQAAGTKDITVTDAQGTAVQDVTLPKNGPKDQKTKLTARAGVSADAKYQWQILASADPELWVNIRGEKDADISVSYPMVRNLIDKDTASTSLRCKIKDGDKTLTSDAVKVTVGEKVRAEAAAHPTKAEIRKAAAKTATDPTPQAVNDNAYKTYNIVINYVFMNGDVVSEPWAASIAEGTNFHQEVENPTIKGYLPYVGEDTESSSKVVLDYTNLDSDHTITVTYKPTNVKYTVMHYQQNVEDDNYTMVEKEEKEGLTESVVPDVAKKYDGFYELIYERPKIAADESTLVEVYYDREYYLMNFNLDGGYGVEPVYAKYGADIGTIGTPTKPGYEFKGWSTDGTAATKVDVPKTMPAKNSIYKAIWEPVKQAKVTVVIWGENADDEKYSYIKSDTLLATPGEKLDINSLLTCGKKEHKHDDSCGLECTHTHNTGCYKCTNSSNQSRNLIETSTPTYTLTSIGDGIYTYTRNGDTYYYVNIGNKWYCSAGWVGISAYPTNKISLDCKHSHNDNCYTCGKTSHTHDDNCYKDSISMDAKLWKLVKSDEVTVAADGSSVINVYYDRTEFTMTFIRSGNTVATIKDKWGANIRQRFEAISNANTFLWSGTSDGESPWTSFMDLMPGENRTYYYGGSSSSSNTQTATYYGENVSGTGYDTLYTTAVKYRNNLKVSEEEFVEIKGFTFNAKESSKVDSNYNGAKFYYTRNSYDLTFNNGYENVKTESVKYEAPLSTYKDYTPDMPTELYEQGSRQFAGWYLNPECTGEEYKLDEHNMPADNLILYAKWIPVKHNVEFYLTKDKMDEGELIGDTHPTLSVDHGSKVESVPATPVNGDYNFVGWFYMDGDEEKAFDFENMPVNKDLKVYGKWSSKVLKQFFVYYKIKETDTEVAAPTTGSSLAGTAKTFEAKGGTDLYKDYQEGYFPLVQSHTMTLDVEDDSKNIYTFEYVQKDAVPYTVKYLDKETNEPVADEKVVSDNRKAVVTETFKPVKGMMPDAYQKRLIVDGSDDAVNEIIFYYTKDTEHAYYKITHYTENLDGETWTEYTSSQAIGDIGTKYTAEDININGFTFDPSVDGTLQSGTLTADGLELKLYYKRNSYPYEVRYLEQSTGKQLADPKKASDKFGMVVSEEAKVIDNYDCVTSSPQNMTIKIEESQKEAKLNIITFYYTEKKVDIKYEVVGPDGCGTVSPKSESLKVVSGKANGSTASANDDFRFVGWYKDKACTDSVDSDLVDGNNKFIPAKVDGKNVSATYYAKFEYNNTDLSITKKVSGTMDENQSFMFRVKGDSNDERTKDIDVTVTIHGEGTVTVKDLPVGKYTVTELTEWSWRYTPDKTAKDITLKASGGNSLTFTNTREKTNWLNGSSWCKNKFKGGEITQTRTTTDNSGN